MTAQPIVPMTDGELLELKMYLFGHLGLAGGEPDRIMGITLRNAERLLARLDATEARALPDPVRMETVEQVEALPKGEYRVWAAPWITYGKGSDGNWYYGAQRQKGLANRLVGAWIIPLPTLTIPTEEG